MTYFIVPGVPIAKPRQTQSDRWKQREPVVKYRQFADLLRLYAHRAGWREQDGGYSITARFVLPVPKSKRNPGLHRVKPDLDNLIKAVSDALFLRDQQVVRIQAEKIYDDGNGPRTEITILSLKDGRYV